MTPRLAILVIAGTAACAGSDSASVVDPPAAVVASVSIAPSSLSLYTGATARLYADARGPGGGIVPGASIAWTSSAPAVATVASDGTVTGVGGGVATVTATSAGHSASATVTVEDVYDLAALGVPKIVTHDYIELAKIARVSRFRSGVGHDYSDDVERCRSMKHYFMPRSGTDWGEVAISSPFAGTIGEIQTETTFGQQVRITSSSSPAVTAILFHVNLDAGVSAGATLAAGQRIGRHIGSQTMSDIALRVRVPGGFRFVSYFDAMDDGVRADYAARGVATREAAIISAAERDASPLSCVGETFQSAGSLPNWLELP